MKKIIVTGILSIVIGLGAGWFIFHPGANDDPTSERKILYYRDPMNPQSTSPTPKKAPDGMDFVPVYDETSGSSEERKIAYYKDPMHPWYTSDRPGKAPDCGMDLVPVYEGESGVQGIKINPVTIQNIGVKVETAERRKLNKVIRTVGKVDYDERKVYSVNSKIMGWVEKLYVDYTGKSVQKGEPLMDLYSPELVTTQEEYLQALQYKKKLQQSSLDEAKKGSDELIQSAKRRLLYWDIKESEIDELERRGAPQKTMTIYSPVDGIVMEKMVQKGQNIMAGMELYKIADLSTVWVLADIYQYELPWVKLGQSADIELSYLPGKTFRGRITYIYPYLSGETKTAKVRIEAANTQHLELKPDMYATVKIVSPITHDAVAVPDQAIIRSGERDVVVVALGGGYFDPRNVKLGVTADGYVQILEGIKEGEKIVVSSQFLIDSESNLKAAIGQMTGNISHPAGSTETEMAESMDHSEGAAAEHKDHDMPVSEKKDERSGHVMKEAGMKNDKTGKSMNEDIEKIFIDPVCGMEAEQDEALSYTFNGKKYYFCSSYDLKSFKENPAKYVTAKK